MSFARVSHILISRAVEVNIVEKMKENTQVKKITASCISLETNLGISLIERF